MKTLLSLFSLIFLYSCMHNQTNDQNQTLSAIYEEIDEESKSELNSYKKPHKIHIDTLLSQNRTQRNYTLSPYDINNIQKMYGFRGIKLRMNFDSIDFGNAKFNERYINRNIKIVTIYSHKNSIKIINDYDKLELTFFENRLSQIRIFNHYANRFKQSSFDKERNTTSLFFISTVYELLVDLFGKPNVDSKYLKHQKMQKDDVMILILFSRINGGKLHHRNSINSIWKSKDIIVNYSGVEYCENQSSSLSDILYAEAEINFKLIEDMSKIKENINIIEDSLRYKSKKDKLQEKF